MAVDYRKILVHYIAHVRESSHDYLHNTTAAEEGLTDEEFAALLQAAEDAYHTRFVPPWRDDFQGPLRPTDRQYSSRYVREEYSAPFAEEDAIPRPF